MKAFYIPTGILAGLLALSLASGSYVQQRTDRWLALAEEARISAHREQWEETERRLLRLREVWMRDDVFLHTIMEHQDLNEAEARFAGALAACRQHDSVELHIHLDQLTQALTILAETQTISIQNVL